MSSTLLDPGDRHFERLYRRYARDVYRFVLAVVRNPTEAEDVTQTAFLNAYKAYKRGERPERPHSWLIAIAHNTIRSRYRFRLRRPREVPFDEAVLDLPVAAEERETVAEVLEALGELPVNQREALAMRELEGRSYGEIAETLGVTVPAVESLIFRARRTLRQKRTSLRGLTVVQLPRSLRTLFHTQPDAVNAGMAAKAAAVVAAATSVVAGGVIGSSDAGASQHPTSLGRHEPSRALVALARPERVRGAVVLRGTSATPARPAAAGKLHRKSRRGAPPASQALPPPAAAAAPTVTKSVGAADDPTAAAAPAVETPEAPAAPKQPVSSPQAAITAATSTLPVPVPAVPAPPAAPVPQPPAVTVPAVPTVPSVPAPPPLPPTPTVTAPQVPGPSGIK